MKLLSLTQIGPVWPAMALCLVFMTATTAFVVFAKMRSWMQAHSLKDLRFLRRLFDAVEMFSTLAILSGMIGTCLGLVEVLPALGEALSKSENENPLQSILAPLNHVWVSTIAGLALGGVWGEMLLFALKPYTRPTLLPLTESEPPSDDLDPENADEDLVDAPDEAEIDDDWRAQDRENVY